METPVRERSLPELLTEITSDLQRLIRDEIRLARTELSARLRGATVGAVWLALAGALALVGVSFFAVATFFALFLVIPGWAAGLVTAVAFLILAGIAALIGRSRLSPERLRPEQTIRSLEEDREWLERRVR